jgi:hypothetical protein
MEMTQSLQRESLWPHQRHATVSSRAIALTAMVAAVSMTAQAADTTVTLACKGTQTSGGGARTSSEVINIGIIVDFQKKTVVGLEPTVPLTIVGLTETEISFHGSETDWQMSGTLDRVTGSLVATSVRSNPNVKLSFEHNGCSNKAS